MPRGYGYFDPQRFASEQMTQNPWYNPLSPSPDIFGGLRGTLNMMWGLKESAREQEEEKKRFAWEQGIKERETAAEEARTQMSLLPKKDSLSEWEAKWDLIDKLPYSEDTKNQIRLGEIDITEVDAKPLPGALKLMKQEGLDPATATPKQISAFNKLYLQVKGGEASREDREAWRKGDVERQTMARNITLLRKYQDDLDEEAKRLADQIEAGIKGGQYSQDRIQEIKKGRKIPGTTERAKEDMLVPKKGYKEYQEAVARHKKALDAKKAIYDYIGMIDMGGVLQPEDMTQITSLVQGALPGSAMGNLPPDLAYFARVNKWTPEQAQAIYQQYLAEQQGIK